MASGPAPDLPIDDVDMFVNTACQVNLTPDGAVIHDNLANRCFN